MSQTWDDRLIWVTCKKTSYYRFVANIGAVHLNSLLIMKQLVSVKRSTSWWRSLDTHEPRHDKTNKVTVRPAKTQISLGIRGVWPESSLSAWRKLGSLATHWAHSEDSDQTWRMPRLIWVFAGCTLILLFFFILRLMCLSKVLSFATGQETRTLKFYIAVRRPRNDKCVFHFFFLSLCTLNFIEM